jgi:hypothetical protein
LSDDKIIELSRTSHSPVPLKIQGKPGPVFPKYAADPANPIAKRLSDLPRQLASSGVTSIDIDGTTYPIYVEKLNGTYWVLILNYVHKGGTNPELFVRHYGSGFPLQGNASLGVDGSQDRTTWGHVCPYFLNEVYNKAGFTKIRFKAWGGRSNRVIHFQTSDTNIINYARTGKGSFSYPFWMTQEAGHTGLLPSWSYHRYSNQGDYALTEFPFWWSGTAHWGIRGGGFRWEVDDFYNPYAGNQDGYAYNTIHQVWIAA